MAARPMPQPAQETYKTLYDTTKKQKQNKATPPSVQTVYNSTAAKSYEQPVPQPPKQTAGNGAVNSSYNPLTTKQNPTAAPSAMDAIYSKPALHGDVPRPQTYLGGYTPPQQNSNQTPKMLKPAGNATTQQKPKMLKPNNTVKTQPDRKVLYGPNREAAQTIQAGTYQTKTDYQSKPAYNIPAANPYTTKDRVTDYGAKVNVPQQNMLGNSVTGLLYNKNEDKSHWGEPKTLKDGAQPKYNRQVYPNSNATASYGPNRETGSMPIPEDENLKKLYREYLKRIGETEGVNREIAQTNFLDPRGQNPIEKIMEKNHFDLSDSKTVVTKDNIYTQPKEKIEIALNETGTFVNSKLYDLKRQREDLLFDVRYGKIDSDDPEIEKVNYDIEYLQHIEKKIKMGLKYHYAFEQDDLNRLSQMNIDDILNSKEEFSRNLPYLSPLAQTIRATGKGLDAYQNSVGVVENIGVEYDLKKELFTIFDKNNPQNKFSFSASLISNPKGYSEYIITPGKNAYKSAEYIQYDLLKALDGKAISKQSIDKLKDIALNDTKSVGKVVDFIGYAIDFADFWIVMDSDKEFNGGEIGVDTYKAGGELIGSIAGDRFGSIAGAKAGAVIGTAAFGPIGTVIGSVLGAAAGAYLLSSVMEEIGEYLGEYVYEYQPADPYQRYYERTK